MLGAASIFDSQEFPRPSLAPAGSIEYRIDERRRAVFVTLAGEVTVESLHSVRDVIAADAAYAPGMDLWIECRVMTCMPSDAEIRSLALSLLLNNAAASHGRIAIVAMTARAYEAASRFELFTDAPSSRLSVFTDPVQARLWLALEPDPDR